MCAWNQHNCALRDGHEGPCLTAKELDKAVNKNMQELEKELNRGIKA